MAGQVGFEPTTSRVTVEVTVFFTTGRPPHANANFHVNRSAVAQLFRWKLTFRGEAQNDKALPRRCRGGPASCEAIMSELVSTTPAISGRRHDAIARQA